MTNKDIPKKAAWAIVLTSANRYVKGIIVITAAMRKLKSQYPVLVLHTPNVPDEVLQLLESVGCILRQIDFIRPPVTTTYLAKRFTETWTKLAVWGIVDYDRLVLMDADMLPLQNMDDLMTMELPSDWVAASHACTCNPEKIASYPASWVPANCAYTGETTDQPPPLSKRDYFNSGLVVLTPSSSQLQAMIRELNATNDLSQYPFPDQDFLNAMFRQKWKPLSYGYNALKTLFRTHQPMWSIPSVRNLHFILTKPWDAREGSDSPDNNIYGDLYNLWWDAYRSQKDTHHLIEAIPSIQ